MDEKDYNKLIKSIQKALNKMNKVKEYNLSGSGWQDFYTSKERAKLYQKNDKAKYEKDAYKDLIYEMLGLLIQLGFSKQNILANFKSSKDREILGQMIESMLSISENENSIKK